MARFNNMKIRILILFLLTAFTLKAQQQESLSISAGPAREAAFKGGEQFTFSVSYSLAKVLSGDVGEVTFKTTNTLLNNIPTYRITANAKTLPNYRLFYVLDDTYDTWLDIETLRPLKFSSRLREDKYRYRADLTYDWDSMVVHTVKRNLKWPEDKSKTIQLTPGSFDALAVFYNLRSQDASSFRPGENRRMELLLDDTIRVVNYKFIGRENKTIKKMGTFRTLKFSCQLATSEGQSFDDGSEFFLWISDDKNKIPLYIESPIKVGSIKGSLVKYQGLKYPLDSKIK